MRVLPILTAALLTATGAFAQSTSHSDMDHSAHVTAQVATDAAGAALIAVNAKMHADMNVPLTGNPDVDFIQGMIPHHQGAVDMAEVVLRYGKDPEVIALARQIIASQETEIAWMKAWLMEHAGH